MTDKPAKFTNCAFIVGPEYDVLIADEQFAEGRRVAIIVHPDGKCTVDLDGYVLAPTYLFTKRQLNNIGKRLVAHRAALGDEA